MKNNMKYNTKNSNESAFPTDVFNNDSGTILKGGLTKREYIATKVLQGMVSADVYKNDGDGRSGAVKESILLTDELLKQLAE